MLEKIVEIMLKIEIEGNLRNIWKTLTDIVKKCKIFKNLIKISEICRKFRESAAIFEEIFRDIVSRPLERN